MVENIDHSIYENTYIESSILLPVLDPVLFASQDLTTTRSPTEQDRPDVHSRHSSISTSIVP